MVDGEDCERGAIGRGKGVNSVRYQWAQKPGKVEGRGFEGLNSVLT